MIKKFKGYGDYKQSISRYSKITSVYLFEIEKTGNKDEEGRDEYSYLLYEFPSAAKPKDVRDKLIEEYLTYKGYTQDKRLRILTQSNIAVSDDYLSLQEAQTKAIRYAEFIYNTGVPADDNQIIKQRTEEKIKAMFFAKHISEDINTFELTNKEALSVKEMYPKWEVGIDVKKGEKRHYLKDDKLYEADQDHKTQADWAPDIMTSLWHEVSEHEGTIDDPIPYNEEMNPFWQGMILEEGKYYTQSGIKYKCTRNTGNKVTHNLSDLVGHFVEIV